MDRLRFTAIAHHDHVFCSPLGEEKADRLVALLDLPPGARVLDAGCGKAELLIRAVERWDARGVGVDMSPYFICRARERIARRPCAGAVELWEGRMETFETPPASFDLAICTGAAQLFGQYRDALRALSALVRPGGSILMGEGYWRREPDGEYLEVLGAPRETYATHAGNVAIGVEEGLVPLYTVTSSEDEWDHYEGLYLRGVERWVAAHPEDPEAGETLLRIRTWRDTYLRWGRDTLGFGFYLFRREGPGS